MVSITRSEYWCATRFNESGPLEGLACQLIFFAVVAPSYDATGQYYPNGVV